MTNLIGDQVAVTFNGMVAMPDVKERLTTLGAEPSNMTSAEFEAWVKAEIPAMAKIVKDEKITVE